MADLYRETMHALGELGIETKIQASPNEVDPAIPFDEDYQHASCDPSAARVCRWWSLTRCGTPIRHSTAWRAGARGSA